MDTTSDKPSASAFDYAMKLLGVRPYSEFELCQKLQKKGFTLKEINSALIDCIRYGFLNDELYAKDYANILSARGYGKFVIIRKLREKRLNEELINQAIAQLNDPMSDAQKSFDFKIRMLQNEKDPRKHREKLYRFMLNKGFTSDIIRQLYDDFLQKNSK